MTSVAIRIVGVAVIGYLIGGIPWALVIGKALYRTDVRAKGSGNLGATNVYRVLGWKAGLATLVLDVLKGMVAVALPLVVVPESRYGLDATTWAQIIAALAVILGHSYSPYIRFKGGKGVATAAGALLVLTPILILIEVAIWSVIVWWTGIVSLGSVIIAFLYPVLAWVFYDDRPEIVVLAVLAAMLVVWRHRSNIVRITRREEPRVSWWRGASRVAPRPPASDDASMTATPSTGASDSDDDGRRV